MGPPQTDMHLTILTTPGEDGMCKGSVWDWFAMTVLKDIHYVVVDVKDIPNIKSYGDRILCLGDKATKVMFGPEVNLFTFRGTVTLFANKIPTVCTFNLDEAYSFKATDFEKEQQGDDEFSKDRGKTSRKNWLFWIEQDTRKLLAGYVPPDNNFKIVACPPIDVITKQLLSLKDRILYLDIETDIESDTIDCIGLAVDDRPNVAVVPIYNWEGKLFYSRKDTLRFLTAFSHALLNNTVVIHNSMFDLLWLASHLRLPFGPRIYDTMVVHKRIWPEIEKSLGHCISLYTHQPYHKDEHTLSRSKDSAKRLWEYNAKDVHSMRLVHQKQLEILAGDPKLLESANQANASLYPYLLASLKGLRVDVGKLTLAKAKLDKRIVQVKRIILRLIGDTKFNPDSPVQLVKYFHDKLMYKVVGRSKQTGKPSLGGKALYQLALKYDNPLIPCILNYRELTKERMMYDFANHRFAWELI